MPSLALHLVTADTHQTTEDVLYVELPALTGQMGILPKHAHMVVGCQKGVMRWKTSTGTHETPISDSIALIYPDRCIVLTT